MYLILLTFTRIVVKKLIIYQQTKRAANIHTYMNVLNANEIECSWISNIGSPRLRRYDFIQREVSGKSVYILSRGRKIFITQPVTRIFITLPPQTFVLFVCGLLHILPNRYKGSYTHL